MPAPAVATLTPSCVFLCKNDTALLGLGRDQILGFDADGLWIFPGTAENPTVGARDAQGTGLCSVVISSDSVWSSGNMHNRIECPLLQVCIYADATRNASNEQVKQDQRSKAWKVYEAVDYLFNDVANNKHDWFGTKVISSRRSYGPVIEPVPDTDGLIRLTVRYEVVL